MKSTKKYTNFDEVARDINALYDAVNKPQQSVGSGTEGKSGDLRFIIDDGKLGYLEAKGNFGWYTTFQGVMIEKPAIGRPYPYFPYLEVDNLYAKIFTVNQITSSNGNMIMSDYGIVESHTNNTITFVDQTNLNLCAFVVNDKCEVRSIKADKSLDIKKINFTVTAVNGRKITVTYASAYLVADGDIVVRVGNSVTASRQNVIYFSTSDINSPYLDLYSGTTGYTFGTPVARIGKLDGITDADFGGALSGYGIYTTNAYFKGKIYLANNGSISLGKTAYTDTTNAGFWLGDSDATAAVNPYFYLGNAGDTKYLKVNTTTGTFETLGFTITGGIIQTATSGKRIVITNNQIDFYDASGAVGSLYGYGGRIESTGNLTINTGSTYFSVLDYNRLTIQELASGLYATITGNGGSLNFDTNNINTGFFFSKFIDIGSSKFIVNSSGNITKINSITYSFPSVAPALNQVLTCTNATGGVLSWSTPSSGVTGSGTINELAYWTGASSLGALAVATYPSLTEISYVKGVTSSIQTQLGNKAPTTAPTFATSITGSYLTASEILITDGSKNIVSAPVVTYPSLTELSYVKGLSSAVQTQINSKTTLANVLATANIFTAEQSFDKFKLNAEVSHSVTATGNYDCTNKNVIILTPTNNGYVASLIGLSNNRPIIVLNASGTYSVTVNSTAGGKLLAVYGSTWVMYNGTSGVTFA